MRQVEKVTEFVTDGVECGASLVRIGIDKDHRTGPGLRIDEHREFPIRLGLLSEQEVEGPPVIVDRDAAIVGHQIAQLRFIRPWFVNQFTRWERVAPHHLDPDADVGENRAEIDHPIPGRRGQRQYREIVRPVDLEHRSNPTILPELRQIVAKTNPGEIGIRPARSRIGQKIRWTGLHQRCVVRTSGNQSGQHKQSQRPENQHKRIVPQSARARQANDGSNKKLRGVVFSAGRAASVPRSPPTFLVGAGDMNTSQRTKRQILFFLAINSVLTAGVFFRMLTGGGDSMPMVMLMMWIPAISSFVTMAVFRVPLSSLGWRPGRLRYLVQSYSLPIAVAVVAYGLVWMAGFADVYVDEVIDYKWARMLGLELPVHPAVGIGSKILWGFLLISFFVLGEEIGWSGFLVPRLLEVASVPATSLIVGLYWSVWHLPALVGGIYGSSTSLWYAVPGISIVFIAVSLMRTILVAKSGSLWTGTLLHLSHNIILMGIFFDLTVKTDTAGILVSESGLVTGLIYMAVAIAFWRWNAKADGEVVVSGTTRDASEISTFERGGHQFQAEVSSDSKPSQKKPRRVTRSKYGTNSPFDR